VGRKKSKRDEDIKRFEEKENENKDEKNK